MEPTTAPSTSEASEKSKTVKFTENHETRLEFPNEKLGVMSNFLEQDQMSGKSSYLNDVMKSYSRSGTSESVDAPAPVKGLNEDKIKQLLDRTGYKLEITTGQRKYGGPPPDWEGAPPGSGCEVFCGKIPKDTYEDDLVPLFEEWGRIWDLRLMMNPLTGTNRGYAFVTFTNREAAQTAVQKLDNYEIKPGKNLKINISVPNLRLFVGNIPKSKGKEEILDEFGKLTAGLIDVIIYSSPDDKKKNRGFCFLEYESHKAASLAKRRLGTGRIKVWGCDIIVDWADPQEEPDEQRMSKVKVLYVRNITQEITEEKLKEEFEQYGKVERVKKIKDYAFIHFEDRDKAVKAMESLDSKELGGSNIEVTLAKPPSDKKKKEEILRARERRMMQLMQVRGGMIAGALPMRGLPSGVARVTGSTMRLPPMGRGDFEYGEYRSGYNDPFYDEFYYYDYQPTLISSRGRSRQSLPEDEGILSAGVYYDIPSSAPPSGRGRGLLPRGRGNVPSNRGAANRRGARRGGGTGGRRGARQPIRGMARPKTPLPVMLAVA